MYMLIDCRIQLTAQPTPGGCRFHFFQVHVHLRTCTCICMYSIFHYSAQYKESRMGGFSVFRHFLSHMVHAIETKKHTNMTPKDY